ncbi:hypothetical protein C8R44DRAFT_698048 [Mycena epipterygia]|nr:hypothetical protein C8R44DRAFT_698048 [Mycena epipterygia]
MNSVDEASTGALPLYSPPPHGSPCYSRDPANDETRLESSARRGTGRLPTGIFTKTYGSATIVLLDQEPDVHVPSYRERRSSVRGSLILERDTGHISEILAKLDCRLELTAVDSAVVIIRTVKNLLWSSGSSESSSSCPGTIDFACDFPAIFQYQDSEYPPPPSYIARFPGFPLLSAKCAYSLTISITKKRRLGFLSKTKVIYIPIEYSPRTYPRSGISATPTPCFLSTVKTMPGEWYQSSFMMNTWDSSTLAPIQCQAFIPSVKVFGLADTIPLHLQISGQIASLRELISPSSAALNDTSDDIDQRKSLVRVFLTRMVTVECHGRTTSRDMRIGEGRFRPLPAVVNLNCNCQRPCNPTESCVQTVDWDGQVKCNPDVTVGGFQAAGLTVKDFITLELIPSTPIPSPLPTMQHAIPIRFVTETFIAPT